MYRWAVACSLIVAGINTPAAKAQDAPPVSRDPRLKIELFAESPQVVTPTGIDVDHQGRVWVIESNTHFPPPDYKGHASDRVLILQDANGDGRSDDPIVFTDGLKFTMSVNVRPTGEVYLATRKEIFLMQDENGDGRADRQKRIVHLETEGNYPHNGLAGFAFDALGWMYFGFGENLGAKYTIVGSDGASLSGGGEGGNIYRCRLDGTKLTQISTGFWNPHANGFDAFGRLFSVDNDPDSRPPCRLLHIVPGGDYGYRFRNGRKGLHPFTAWNGEIPGTLPMVAGTGEAPSGIVAYESDGLPEEYRGQLLVTSWGDHRIDRFNLTPQGTSFSSLLEPLITGGENFRPVGLAVAPDGSLYCSDWVLRDYKLHGKGRVWRIAPVKPPERKVIDLAAITPATANLQELAGSTRLEARRAAARSLAKSESGLKQLAGTLTDTKFAERTRIEALWALAGSAQGVPMIDTEKVLAERDRVATAFLWLLADPQADHGDLLKPMRGSLNVTLLSNGKHVDPLFPLALLANATNLFGSSEAVAFANLDDPFLFGMLVEKLKGQASIKLLETSADPSRMKSPRGRLAVYLTAFHKCAAASQDVSQGLSVVGNALRDPDADIRRAAIQFIAEHKLKDFRERVSEVLSDASVTTDLFLATLAALEMLDGVDPAAIDKAPVKYVLPLVRDDKRPGTIRAQALRLTSPAEPALNAELLKSLLASDHPGLQLEAIRTLQSSPIAERVPLLQSVAQDTRLDSVRRLEAVLGLSVVTKPGEPNEAARKTLLDFSKSSDPTVRREAIRGLRSLAEDPSVRETLLASAATLHSAQPTAENRELADQLALALDPDVPPEIKSLQPQRPMNRSGWDESLQGAANADAGRRVFFYARGAGCGNCHTVNGRGGRVGPDLSTIGRTLSREKLIDSILVPSKEVAPQFVAWVMEDSSGRIFSGLIVSENEGHTILGNADGAVIDVPTAQIVERVPQKISLMPERLTEKMTLQECRDLIAFLESLK